MDNYADHEHPFRPLSPAVRAAARHFLRAEPAEGFQPLGLLVGEQPGKGHNPRLPLWPYPMNSAGARLQRMSGLPVDRYLERLARVNLVPEPVAKWDAEEARRRALSVMLRLPPNVRIVAVGARARDAFGLPGWFEMIESPAALLAGVAIPHTSGRCREYNDPTVRETAGTWLRWAARLGR